MVGRTMVEAQEDFQGNDKHYKMLHKALSENDISIWNKFAASMGPRFRADLRGIRLEGRNLAGAKLTGARLEGACLDGADLTGADLTGASLTGASLREAKLVGTPKLKNQVKVTARKTEPESTDPEVRRRRKIEGMQERAKEFLEERARKEQALEKQKAQVRARNNPSPFTNNDR